MKNSFIGLVFMGLVVTGCGRKLTPVSITTKTETKADSSNIKTININSDSSYVERLIKKILTGSTAATNITPQKWDSLVSVIRSMPLGFKEIYLSDPKKDVYLKLLVDKNNELILECHSRDKEYFERETETKKHIAILTNQLIERNKTTLIDTREVVKEEKGFWNRLKSTFADIYMLLAFGFILFALMAMGFFWIKSKFRELTKNDNQ